jgi:CRP-like cAMP-binding protein
VVERLKKTQLFQGFEADILDDIAAFCRILVVPDGGELFAQEGAKDTDLYVLMDGTLTVHAQYEGRRTKREMLLSSVDQEVFGEVGWLLGLPRTALIRSSGDARVLRIDGVRLRAYLDAYPELGYRFMMRISEVLARKLATSNSMFRMLLSNSFAC